MNSHRSPIELLVTNRIRPQESRTSQPPRATKKKSSSLHTQKVQFSQFRMKVEELHGLGVLCPRARKLPPNGWATGGGMF